MKFNRIEFASRRRKAQDDLIAALEPIVVRALERKREGSDTWWRPVLDAAHDLFNRLVIEDGGAPQKAAGAWAVLSLDLVKALTKTRRVDEHTPAVIAGMIGNDLLSVATIAAAAQAGEPYELEWISMHDGNVRHTHRVADGQRIRPGDKFLVGESQLRRPGDVTAPIKEWVNCRCTVAAVPMRDNEAASVDTEPGPTQGEPMTETIVAAADTGVLLPWHGVLAPEGVWSGDKRMFKQGALSHRDLPLPLTYQKTTDEGHKGSVTVGSIDWVDQSRGDGMMHAGGRMLSSPEADEAVGLMSHFGRFGVSVDADEAEFDLEEDDDGVAFDHARVCSASMVSIPAFAEAYIQLGDDPDYAPEGEVPAEDLAASLTAPEGSVCAHEDCSETPTVSVPTANPDLEVLYCATHAGEHEGQELHSSEVIDLNLGWAAMTDEEREKARAGLIEAGRGPGWLTNPEDTKRIHDYWTKPGEPGYVKVGWGTPGDFERCRVEIGEEIGENSPEDLRFLNQICAQWHHDATGFWPGKAPAERGAALEKPEGEQAPAVSLVASTHSVTPPHEWFENPNLDRPTPIQITDDGHIFGHVSDWTTCHMAFNAPGQCINPEPSKNNYAYYRCGEVMTDAGPVATGPITLATGHAGQRLGMRAALAHYDNTSTAVADVAAGDDEHGIWINGWVRPWISDEKKYELRAHPPSGDWRRNPNSGDFDMIAVLSVNAPGLPVRRVGFSDGQQVSLVASLGTVSEDPIGEIAGLVADEIEARQKRRDTLAALARDFAAADRERLAGLSVED